MSIPDPNKVDAFGNPIPDVNAITTIHDAHALTATGVSLVDKKGVGDTDATPDQKIAELTKRYDEAVAKIKSMNPKAADGLPGTSTSVGAMESAVAAVEKKRDSMEAKRNEEAAKEIVGMLAGGAMLAAADKGMLPAGNGVYSPEELAKRNGQQPEGNSPEVLARSADGKAKMPINKELEEMLAKGGFNKEALMLAGVKGGKDIGGENSALLANDPKLPITEQAIARTAQENSRAMQRSKNNTANA